MVNRCLVNGRSKLRKGLTLAVLFRFDAPMALKWQFFLYPAAGMALLTTVVLHLALAPWRRSAGRHWTERARLLWPARRVSLAIVFACSLSGGFLGGVERASGLVNSYSVAGMVCGFLAGTFFFTRAIEPRYGFLTWLSETFWMVLVQFGIYGILLGLMWSMPNAVGPAEWLRFAVGLVGVLVIATGVWLPLLKLFPHKRKPEEERLEALVREVSVQTGVTPRWTFFSKSPKAFAGALVHLRSLVLTSRLMEILNDEELRAVLHHEVAHLREGFGVKLSRLLPIMGISALAFMNPVEHRYGATGIVLLFLCPVLCARLARAIARRMEHRADDAAIQGADPVQYARALEKLYEANQMPAVMRSNSMVHPHLYDRMLAAGVTPDYARPERPGIMAWPGWVVLLMPAALMVLMLTQITTNAPRSSKARAQPRLENHR